MRSVSILLLIQIYCPIYQTNQMEKETVDQSILQQFINAQYDGSVLLSLTDYIRIKNVTHDYYIGNDAEWERDREESDPDLNNDGGYNLILRAGKHIAKWVEELGVKGAKVQVMTHTDKSITPIILTEIEADRVGDNQKDTYFFYGHFDKQPPMDDVSPWQHGGPYDPEIVKEGDKVVKIYGRGGADDGYSTYATMIAIKALQEQKIPLPRIVMITQGDEQSGRGDVQYWIENLLPRFGTPKLVFCLDSGTLDYDRFWLTNSLRGYLVAGFKVKVLNGAVHSGSGSGVIPTCFRIIRQLLQRIQSATTGEISLLNVDIPANRLKEVEDLVATLGPNSITHYPTVPGLETPDPDYKETILNNTWRAQMEVLAIDGYPSVNKSSNIIIPEVSVKISIRLPPTLPNEKAVEIVENEIYNKPTPYHCEITKIIDTSSDKGFDAPINPANLVNVFEQASKIVFGDTQSHLSMGQGGSIPFMNFLKTKWPNAHFVITGLLGPDSNAHGPNECLNYDYLKKLTACFSQIIAKSVPLYFNEKDHKDKTHHECSGHKKAHNQNHSHKYHDYCKKYGHGHTKNHY